MLALDKPLSKVETEQRRETEIEKTNRRESMLGDSHVFSSGQYQLHIYFLHLSQEGEFIVYRDKEVGFMVHG